MPASMTRDPDGKYTLRIGAPLQLTRTGHLRADIVENSQRCQDAIEQLVRAHPEQWLWAHRRWKARPQLEAEWQAVFRRAAPGARVIWRSGGLRTDYVDRVRIELEGQKREVGELLVRNPGREREYFRDPEATARTWRGGWLHTGDLARLDEDGYLYIVGRQKDVIIRGGNNVHAADVEAVLYEHPAVGEAAVAGVEHPVLGEDVGAWIVLAPGAVASAGELRAFCAERLSDHKVPRSWTFLDELPRNATGKVLKLDLPGRSGG